VPATRERATAYRFTTPPDIEPVKATVTVDLVWDGGRKADAASITLQIVRKAPNAEATVEKGRELTKAKVQPRTPEIGFSAGPSIKILEIPVTNERGGPTTAVDIAGKVVGITSVSEYRVVLYARARTPQNEWVWYVQAARGRAVYQDRHEFDLDHLDTTGACYAALLVKRSYRPPPATLTAPVATKWLLKTLFHTRNVSTEKGESMRLFASIPAVTIATWAVLSGGAPLAGQAKDSPSISITGVPPAGSVVPLRPNPFPAKPQESTSGNTGLLYTRSPRMRFGMSNPQRSLL